MSVVQRKAMLKSEGFFPHKKNAKGTTIIYSRKHPTAKSVRVVIDSGIDSTTNKVVGKLGIKLCYVNRQKSWREITGQVFTTNTGLVNIIKSQEAAEKLVKSCKHCKAKKFTAKSGNIVCANACWIAWSGSKNETTNKSRQKTPQKAAQKKPQKASQKKMTASEHYLPATNPQKVTPKSQRTYPANRSSQKSTQKKSQKIVAEILPGDLVSVEEIQLDKVTHDYTGSILGIVMKTDQFGKTYVNWTANTTSLPDWDMPFANHYQGGQRRHYRFKVLSRSVEWGKAS